jgi:hypothetical protein
MKVEIPSSQNESSKHRSNRDDSSSLSNALYIACILFVSGPCISSIGLCKSELLDIENDH